MRLLAASPANLELQFSSTSNSSCNSHTCRWKPYSNSNDFEANAAVFLILLFSALICALSLYAAIRCFLRPSLQHETDDQKPNPEPATSATTESPILVYSSDLELAGAEAECAICLSEFEEGESIRVLERCQHGFHVKCIQQWLSSRSSCPTCRTPIFSLQQQESKGDSNLVPQVQPQSLPEMEAPSQIITPHA